MKRTQVSAQLQKLLAATPYVAIATVCPNGRPWNTPVVGRFDDDLNLYWVSWRQNQHSRNIAREPRVFVVMYDSSAPEGQGEGLYLQMRAQALGTRREIQAARQTYDTSFFRHPFRHEQFLGNCPQRFYKAVPEYLWYNGDGEADGHFVDVRHAL
ncbi:MAG TPA: pyridoxamine 5'-phosphate oxidase family protein [Candidatus Saccharimonadales bacterium]|nr:pyridoxamine 5'-phosphate oxidase family protein [Candidatus Saccharimonadales bacterium]